MIGWHALSLTSVQFLHSFLSAHTNVLFICEVLQDADMYLHHWISDYLALSSTGRVYLICEPTCIYFLLVIWSHLDPVQSHLCSIMLNLLVSLVQLTVSADCSRLLFEKGLIQRCALKWIYLKLLYNAFLLF